MTTPVDRYALVRRFEHGFSAFVKETGQAAAAYNREVRAKGGFETDHGEVSFRKGEETIDLPLPALLDWAREHMEHEVVEAHEVTTTVPASVHPSLYKTLLGEKGKPGRFQIDGEKVVDTQTGEILGWAAVTPAGDDVPVFTPSRDQKAEAVEWVAGLMKGRALAELTGG